MPRDIQPQETSFHSKGTRLSAWRLGAVDDRLASDRGRPCVVMAHGFGATKDGGLLHFAERFAALGCEVLLFDYRGFGTSEGTPRQLVSHLDHRTDYHAALAHARGMSGIDPSRIVLWGSSYSGGHVVAVAAKDRGVAGVISQCAAMDGLTAFVEIGRYAGIGQLLRLGAHGALDAVGRLLGRPDHLIPIVGPPGSLAAITAADSMAGYELIMGPTFRNQMCARAVYLIPFNRPVRSAAKLRCPILVVVAGRDTIAPPAAVRKVASRARRADTLEFDCAHFDIYTGELFETSVTRQCAFLTELLTPATAG